MKDADSQYKQKSIGNAFFPHFASVENWRSLHQDASSGRERGRKGRHRHEKNSFTVLKPSRGE